VSTGREAGHIRKIEILCDQEALSGLHRAPHVRVGATDQVLCVSGIDVVSEDRNEASGRFSSSLIFTV
jgi:hypothetical protein